MRLRLFQIVARAQENDTVSRWYDIFIVSVAFLSIIPLCFKEGAVSAQTQEILDILDIATVFILFADYFFRWLTYDIKIGLGARSFLIYPFTPMAFIDIISILPSITILSNGFKFLRVLRIVRVLRMSKGMTIMTNVFIREIKPLMSVIFFICVYIFTVGLIMFNIEPSTFNTFLDAIYWSTTALATIGYGDIYPQTNLGQAITVISSIVGIAVIAFPAGIITGGYITQLNAAKKQGDSYFNLPVRHDKVFIGKQPKDYTGPIDYFKQNKKVAIYFAFIIGGMLLTFGTDMLYYVTQPYVFFDEFGAVVIAIILEPAAGIIVGLASDCIFAIYAGTASEILYFGNTVIYICLFVFFFRRGKKIRFKSVVFMYLVGIIVSTIYALIIILCTGDDGIYYYNESIDYCLQFSEAWGIQEDIALAFLIVMWRLVCLTTDFIMILLIRKFIYDTKLDPMQMIPASRRYRYKIYKWGKTKQTYIENWVEETKANNPEWADVAEEGKTSIAESKEDIRDRKRKIERMEEEIRAYYAEIALHRNAIVREENKIGVKKRAVRKVRRKEKWGDSDGPEFSGDANESNNQNIDSDKSNIKTNTEHGDNNE